MPAISSLRFPQPRCRAPARQARGFTLIELLVVLLIIVIVAGLVIVGITSILGSMRDDSTQTRMEMLNSFMAAYANAENARAGGQGNTRAMALPSALQAIALTGDYYSTVDGYFDPNAANITDAARPREPLRAPGRFNDDSWVVDTAAARTQAVLKRLLSVPANQSAFATLPEDAKTAAVPGQYRPGGPDSTPIVALLVHAPGPTGPDADMPRPLDPPLLVDGHGNIIVFIPEAGLTDVSFADGTQLLYNTSDPDQSPRLVAADGSAFWASGGPDGNLQTGDDNVYSTQVIVRDPANP
jgi:prepilin-type N-terminal cleavage/methylation domain-containing protein